MAILFQRAAKANYTGVVLTDSKFGKLGDMNPHYFQNVERIKQLAAENHLDIVPCVFPIGYSESLLWNDPNLAEGFPVKDAIFTVHDGHLQLVPDPAIGLRGGDFADLKKWDWHDPVVTLDHNAARITDPKGANARVMQKITLLPFRQYHLSVRIKTEDFKGTPEIKLLAGKNRSLIYTTLVTKPTQDFTVTHVVFNSLEYTEGNLYLGAWGATTGSLWFSDAKLEETALVNLIRRPGAPLTIKYEPEKKVPDQPPVEGRNIDPLLDPRSGTVPWKGSFNTWHEPPVIKTSLPENTRLRISYYHALPMENGQVNICPSEPKTVELLRDQARRVHAAFHAKAYFMEHDEVRELNQCDACAKRELTAGQVLADNVKTCIQILREINPKGQIFVWSDMFDPNHNAHDNYYLVRSDLTNSWLGLDKNVNIVLWNDGTRDASLKFFTSRGNHVLIAAYYDAPLDHTQAWLDSAQKYPASILGIMYTTWRQDFSQLEPFAKMLAPAGANPLATRPAK